MSAKLRPVGLPTLISGGSLLFIIILTLFTDPVKDVVWAILFFIALFGFLTSGLSVLAGLQRGQVSPKTWYRILLISGFIDLGLMLRSSGSLSLIDGLVLMAIIAGLGLYFSKRRS